MGSADGHRSDDTSELETRAVSLCRMYGAGSPEYSAFLADVNSTLLGAMLTLPKFVPGDIKNANGSKKGKKKKHHKRRSQQSHAGRQVEVESDVAGMLEKVEEEEPRMGMWEMTGTKGRMAQKSLTMTVRETEREDVRALRRSQSTLGDAEQFAMDEQVALQLQTLVREKAELIKENSRLKNENEGLKTLLEYATCEATADDDGEESDYETSKEVLRCPGIQAWHPPELHSPTSFSSYGMLGSTSSSNDDKDQQTQASDEAYHLTHIRT